MNWLLRAGIFGVCLGPLVPNHYLPWTSFHAEATTIVGFGLISAFCIIQNKPSIWPRIALLPILLSVVPLVQASIGEIYFWGDAWTSSAYLLLFSLSVATGSWLRPIDSAAAIRFSAACVAMSAVLSVAVALDQWLGLNQWGIFAADLPPGSRPFANLGQPNQFATWLVLGLIAINVLFEYRALGISSYAAATCFLCFGLAMPQSRTTWVEIAVLLIGMHFARSRFDLRLSQRSIALTGLAFLMLYLAWPSINQLMQLAPGRTLQEQTEGGRLRWTHWETMIDAISKRPFLGYGWNQASVAQAEAATRHPPTAEMLEHSHNFIIDLLVWNGIPLGVLVVLILATWFWTRLRSIRHKGLVFGFMGIAVVFVHGLFEFPLEYTYFFIPVGLLIGLIERSSSFATGPTFGIRGSAAFASGTFVLLVWIAHDYAVVEDNNRSMRFEMARIGPVRPPTLPPDIILLTQQREFLKFARTAAVRGMPADQLDWMRKVSERYGYPPVLLRYALAAGLNGDPDGAAQALQRLCKTQARARCEEGLDAWEIASTTYPELALIPLPPRSNSTMPQR